MCSKADAVRAMDHHWRYADLPTRFKRWWAIRDWKKRRTRGPQPNTSCRDRSRTLNQKLIRAGRADLVIQFPEDK